MALMSWLSCMICHFSTSEDLICYLSVTFVLLVTYRKQNYHAVILSQQLMAELPRLYLVLIICLTCMPKP
jgi:hypothetical protein